MRQATRHIVADGRWDVHRHRVFRDGSWLDNPFREQAWGRLLLPYDLGLPTRVAAALSLVSGDSFALVFAREHEFEGYHACRVALRSEPLSALATETPFGATAVDVCSESESWGLIADPENVCLLGGADSIIQGIADNLGGMQAVQDVFIAAVREGDVGFGERAMRFLEDLVESVGWPRPTFANRS